MAKDVKIEQSWRNVLSEEFEKPYFDGLTEFVKGEILAGKKIFPAPRQIFAAFDFCPFDKLRVVILGQDPYHTLGAAHGLCFSVPNTQPIPPSLQNIYKEILQDEEIDNFLKPDHGNLEKWAAQGILLLNATLTVQAHKPTSHAGKGWEIFTDEVIKHISDNKEGVIFLLWGNFAKSKANLIDKRKHVILTAAHPSPFSANNGFFGCKHFSKVNKILRDRGEVEINWQV